MKITDLFSLETAESDINDGYLRAGHHPDHPELVLLNYTEKAQFDNHWNQVTLRCRGLVYSQYDMEVVALPFEKFHNFDQHGPQSVFGELPNGPFDVFDKMDGSLGIFFNFDGHWLTATRGSFASDQAQWAQSWLDDHIQSGYGQFLDPRVTYLAEIIYPANRIVVDYDGLEDCVLLGGYSLDTGNEIDIHHLRQVWPGPSVRPLSGFETLAALTREANDNNVKGTVQEGYVVRFKENGQRAKIKFADYKRIHGLFTETNEKTIHTILAAGGDLRDLMSAKDVPDELYAWCRQIESELNHAHSDLLASVHDAHQLTLSSLREHDIVFTRKDFALMAKKVVEPRLLKAIFLVLDANHVKLSNWAWRQLEPSFGGRRPGQSEIASV